MSGGVYELVAACYTNVKTNKLTSNTESTYINKYIDVYSVYDISKYGDAVYETSSLSNDSNSWFKDHSKFVYLSNPLFARGGLFTNGANAGLFNFFYHNGDVHGSYGFRTVCVVK